MVLDTLNASCPPQPWDGGGGGWGVMRWFGGYWNDSYVYQEEGYRMKEFEKSLKHNNSADCSQLMYRRLHKSKLSLLRSPNYDWGY